LRQQWGQFIRTLKGCGLLGSYTQKDKGNSYGDLMLPDGISIEDIDLGIGQPPDRSRIESIAWTPLDHIFVGHDGGVQYHLFKDDALGKYVITKPRFASTTIGA
jgi:hypothetical protein